MTELTLGSRLFAALQYVLPKHVLSRLMYHLMRSRRPVLKKALVKGFLRGYRVDMSEALQPDPLAYPSFNDFFTRALKADARPVTSEPDTLISPVDGTLSQHGPIDEQVLIQAKGRDYSLPDLLAGDAAACERYRGGSFACIYLAPYNYHRIHMPCSGQLRGTLYVPGDLFSVNRMTVNAVPRVFARNERVICEFDTDAGPMAMIAVGALFVGSMELVHCGEVNPPPRARNAPLVIPTGVGTRYAKGAELGRFNMGSTVILLFGSGRVAWGPQLVAACTLRMGESIGKLCTQPTAATR